MNTPTKDNAWETFIKIGKDNYMDVLRKKVKPFINELQKYTVDWYCFLVHNRTSGVPCKPRDKNLYYHIRYSAPYLELGWPKSKQANPLDNCKLPPYCQFTRQMKFHPNDYIVGINTDFLKDKNIMLAWKYLGEQSEMILKLLEIHNEMGIPEQHMAQFFHFWSNMTGFTFAIYKHINITHLF